jgi:hypothetical protein
MCKHIQRIELWLKCRAYKFVPHFCFLKINIFKRHIIYKLLLQLILWKWNTPQISGNCTLASGLLDHGNRIGPAEVFAAGDGGLADGGGVGGAILRANG